MKPDLAALDAGLARYLDEIGLAAGQLAMAPPAQATGAARRLVHADHHARLWAYEAPEAKTAIVIVYAFVNRPHMLDLDERRSLIRRLLEQQISVYLIEWQEPDQTYAGLELASCVLEVLPALLQRATGDFGAKALPVLGVCQGGSLSLMLAARRPASLSALVLLVTPVDFQSGEDDLRRFTIGLDTEALRTNWRSLPPAILDHLFLCLKPFELRAQKYLHAHRLAERPQGLAEFLRMESWIFGGPRQSTALVADFVRQCYQNNALLRGTLRLHDRDIRLSAITAPVLNVYASADHLVPPAASRALAGKTAGDYQELAFVGGHIGIFVSERAQSLIASGIADWLFRRENITTKA